MTDGYDVRPTTAGDLRSDPVLGDDAGTIKSCHIVPVGYCEPLLNLSHRARRVLRTSLLNLSLRTSFVKQSKLLESQEGLSNRITVKNHEVFVNLTRCLRADSLDCFVPRNDRRIRSGSVLNFSRCLRANSSDCFVPRNDRRLRCSAYNFPWGKLDPAAKRTGDVGRIAHFNPAFDCFLSMPGSRTEPGLQLIKSRLPRRSAPRNEG